MKLPILTLTAFALTLSIAQAATTEAQRDAQERAQRKAEVESAWDRIEDVGADLRDATAMAIDNFLGAGRNAIHSRPELQGVGHLVVLKKGEDVKIAYCRWPLSQLFRDRNKHPSHNRCDEVLTKGSFNIDELQSCTVRHSQEGGAAFNLQRQLARVERRSSEPYNYNYEAMYGTREEYRQLFRVCSAEIARAKAAKARKAAPPPVAVEPQPAPAPAPAPAPVPAAAGHTDDGHFEPFKETSGVLPQ